MNNNSNNNYLQHQQQQFINHNMSGDLQQQQQIIISPIRHHLGQSYPATTSQQQQQPYMQQFIFQNDPSQYPLTMQTMQPSYHISQIYQQPVQSYSVHLQQQTNLPPPASIISPPMDKKPIPPWQKSQPQACFPMSSYLSDDRYAETPAPIPIECQLGPETPSPSLPSTSPSLDTLLDTSEILRTMFGDSDETTFIRLLSNERSPRHRRTKAQMAADRRAELEKTLKNCTVNIKLMTFDEADLPARIFVGSNNKYEIRTNAPRVPRMKLVPAAYKKVVNIGFILTQHGFVFSCLSHCHFKAKDPVKFQQHLANHKVGDEYKTISGSCGLCKEKINSSSPLYELLHLIRSHLIPGNLPIDEIMYSRVRALSCSDSDVTDNEEDDTEEEQAAPTQIPIQIPTEIDPITSMLSAESDREKQPGLEDVTGLEFDEDEMDIMASAMDGLDDIFSSEPVPEDANFNSEELDSFFDTQKVEDMLEKKDPDYEPDFEVKTAGESVLDEAFLLSDEGVKTDVLSTEEDCDTSPEETLVPSVPLKIQLIDFSKTHKKHKKKKKKKKKLSLEIPKSHKHKRKSDEKKEKSGKKRRRRVIQESDSSDTEQLTKKPRSSETSSPENSPACSEECQMTSSESSSKGSNNDSKSSIEPSPIEFDNDRTNDSGIVVQHRKKCSTEEPATDVKSSSSLELVKNLPTTSLEIGPVCNTATHSHIPHETLPTPVEAEIEQDAAQEKTEPKRDCNFLQRIPLSLVEKIKLKALSKDKSKKVNPMTRALEPTVGPQEEAAVPMEVDKTVETNKERDLEETVATPAEKYIGQATTSHKFPPEKVHRFEFIVDSTEIDNTVVEPKKKRGRPKKPGNQTARKRPGGSQTSTLVKKVATVKEEPVENLLDQMKPCSVYLGCATSKMLIKNATKGKEAFVQFEISSEDHSYGEVPTDLESNTSKIINLPEVPSAAAKIRDFDLSTLSDISTNEIEYNENFDHSYCDPPVAVQDFPAVMEITVPADVEEDVFFDSFEVIPETVKATAEAEASSDILSRTARVLPLPQVQKPVTEGNDVADDDEMLVHSSQETTNIATKNVAELYPWIDDDIVEKWVKAEHCAKVLLEEKCQFSSYKCMSIECSFFTLSLSKFQSHIEEHRGKDRFFICNFCLVDEKDPEDLCKHILQFHLYDRFQCSKCMYRSCEKFYCDLHRKKFHPNQKVSILKSSDQKLMNKVRENAQKELQEKLDEIVKPLKCEFCSKKFHNLEGYIEHLGVEAEKTNDQAKAVKINLEIQKIQQKSLNEVNEFGLYRCLYCPDAFQEEALIREHLSVVHPQHFSFVCIRKKPEVFIDLDNPTNSKTVYTSVLDLVDKKMEKELRVKIWKGNAEDLTSADDAPEEPLKCLKILNAFSLPESNKYI